MPPPRPLTEEDPVSGRPRRRREVIRKFGHFLCPAVEAPRGIHDRIRIARNRRVSDEARMIRSRRFAHRRSSWTRAISEPAIVAGFSAWPAARTAISTPSLSGSPNSAGRSSRASAVTSADKGDRANVRRRSVMSSVSTARRRRRTSRASLSRTRSCAPTRSPILWSLATRRAPGPAARSLLSACRSHPEMRWFAGRDRPGPPRAPWRGGRLAFHGDQALRPAYPGRRAPREP